MMKFNPLHSFISPVTGRILATTDYVPYGDRQGIATPSPILIDIRLDLMKLQQEIDNLPAASTPFPDTLDFILGSPSPLVPNAQVLSSLSDGYVVNNAGVLSTTNTMTLPDLEKGKIWLGDDQNKAIVVDTNNEVNLPELGVTVVPEPTGGFVGKVWMGTSSGRPEASSLVGEMFADIEALNAKFLTGTFIMKSGLAASYPRAQFLSSLTAGALVKVNNNGSGSLDAVLLSEKQILMGGIDGMPEGVERIAIENLPTLTNGNIWLGDENGIPIESVLPVINLDATFITQKPDDSLANAQALNSLGAGMAKIEISGAIALAIADTDYATVTTLERIKEETEAIKEEAVTSAEEASTAATEASASASEATGAAGEASGAAGEASAAAGEATGAAATATGAAFAASISSSSASSSSSSASSSASDADDYADDAKDAKNDAKDYAHSAEGARNDARRYLEQLLATSITLTGDVSGANLLSSPINLTFAPNPVFMGNAFMRIPFGTTAQRPSNPSIGMTRVNTDF